LHVAELTLAHILHLSKSCQRAPSRHRLLTGSAPTPAIFNSLIRAVDIASLPMQNLQNDVTTAHRPGTGAGQHAEHLQFAPERDSGNRNGPEFDVGHGIRSFHRFASATSSALPGTYTIQVTGLGSSTTTLSNAGSPPITDPTSPKHQQFLHVHSDDQWNGHYNHAGREFAAGSGQRNKQRGVAAQATIVNVGSNASSDYRLSVVSNNLAADTIQLSDGTNTSLSRRYLPAPRNL